MKDAAQAISPRDSASGLPCSVVISAARSSWQAAGLPRRWFELLLAEESGVAAGDGRPGCGAVG